MSAAAATRVPAVAVIGAGISGLTAAYKLQDCCRLAVFEAEDRIGGHTHTVTLDLPGGPWHVDTGFIVFNHDTYPQFTTLLRTLGIDSQPSVMSFSVRDEAVDFEYRASSLNTLFAQRRNLLRPRMYRLMADILRFRRESVALLDDPHAAVTLGAYLAQQRYAAFFISHFIVPMGAAIWSASSADTLQMPAAFFARFFHHHGFLRVHDQPQWRVVKGGSCAYLAPLTAGFAECIRVKTPVERVQRMDDHVAVQAHGAAPEHFDYVIIAAHADQALRMLADATPAERELLHAFPYQDNDVVLHTDTRMMPRRRRAWASWNYHLTPDAARRVAVSYNMNILQTLPGPHDFMVTLNRSDALAPGSVLRRFTYAHPLYTHAGIAAQARWDEINGARRTFYCGAYWRNGFHEDGVVSGQRAAAALRALLSHNNEC